MPALLALIAGWGLAAVPASADPLPPPQFVGVPIPEGRIDKALEQLDTLAADIMKRTGIPGMAVAVVRDGRTVYAKGFGVRKAGEDRPVDADTVFQIASVSKSLSASVVAHQVGKGAVAWDTPVVKYLPWFRLKDPWVTSHVTIGDMFAHRSGLPDHGGDVLEDLGYDRRQVLERLRFLPLDSFRDSYAYTNFGLTAAAEAVAVAAKKDWASLAEEVLFKPLGMTSTSACYADFISHEDRAYGHVKEGERWEAKYQREPDAQAPAGGLSSTVNDLARWMAMVLANGRFDGREIVSIDALLPAITAQIVSSPSAVVEARPGFYGYGFGVGIAPSGRTTISHSGAFALGAGTNYLLIPSAGIGIVVLTNAAPTGAAESLAMSFGDHVQFGDVTRDWLAAYGPVFAQMEAPTGKLLGAARPARLRQAEPLSAYAGRYGNEFYGDLEVVRRGDGLVLRLGPARVEFPLTHWDGDVFVFSPSSENANPGSLSQATFTPGESGRARSVLIEYLDEDGMGRFVRR